MKQKSVLASKITRQIIKLCNTYLKSYQILITKSTDQIIKVDNKNYFQDGMYIENQSSFRDEAMFKSTLEKLILKVGVNYEMDWRTYMAMELSAYANSLDGDFVELGSGEGWIINAIMLRNPDLTNNREVHLFDKFDGLEVDIRDGQNTSSVHPRYPNGAKNLFKNLEITENVNIYSVHLPEGLEVLEQKRIAFLHIDLNAAQTEVQSLRKIYCQIVPNGVILLDDYCGRGRQIQHEAINSLANELDFKVISLPTGQGLVIKSYEI